MTLNKYPKNKKHYQDTVHFYHKIKPILDKLNIKPIISGSFALFYHTKNSDLTIHDIDFLISKENITKLMIELEKNEIPHNFEEEWQMLQIKGNNLLLEFDSIDFWHPTLNLDSIKVNIEDTELNILNKESLTKVYEIASIQSDEKEINKEKLKLLTNN